MRKTADRGLPIHEPPSKPRLFWWSRSKALGAVVAVALSGVLTGFLVLFVSTREAVLAPEQGPDRPFSADSPWNTPIPDNPVLDPDTERMIENLTSGERPAIANLYDYGARIYEASVDTSRYDIDCTEPWGTCSLEEAVGVPIPEGALANSGSDRGMNIIDRSNGRGYCFWRYNNDRASTSWGEAYDLDGDGDGLPPSCTGAGLPGVGGVVRLTEIQAEHIPHALVFASRFCADSANGGGFRYPAGKSDGTYSGVGAIPEGARLQLDPAVNVDAIPGITPGEILVAKALQTYGAYLGDCGDVNMAFTFEHPGDGSDPYPTVGFQWDYYAMTHIPWNRIRVLHSWDGR